MAHLRQAARRQTTRPRLQLPLSFPCTFPCTPSLKLPATAAAAAAAATKPKSARTFGSGLARMGAHTLSAPTALRSKLVLSQGKARAFLEKTPRPGSLALFAKIPHASGLPTRRLTVMRRLEGASNPVQVSDIETKETFVFKATSSEPKVAMKNGVTPGNGTLKEVVAFLLDHQGWAGVPRTDMVTAVITDKLASGATRKMKENEAVASVARGSMQAFVTSLGTADDYGPSLFDKDAVHKVGVLDIRLANLDRHLANILVLPNVSEDRGSASRRQWPSSLAHRRGMSSTSPGQQLLHLCPIDHAYVLPRFRDLSDINFEWLYWRQSKAPFSGETLRYIDALEPFVDAGIIRSVGLPDSCAITCVLTTIMLKEGSKMGLTLSDLGAMMQREPFCGPDASKLERLIEDCCDAFGKLESKAIRGEQKVLRTLGPKTVFYVGCKKLSLWFSLGWVELTSTT
uniref:PI3K/PI4K catalytic domain-containing protein n=1 Tax=Lotharella globosa TaxID=91324 RepID=A0A7S3ZDD5_9EUKA